MHKGQVTIKDIAKELGISPSTVSRALKDHPDISPDTKKAVNDLAEKWHYKPDPIALSLKSRRSKIIGVIIPEVVHYFFSTVISGIEDVAYEANYQVMICESNESYEREVKNVDALLSSRVEGILVSVAKETKKIDHFRDIQQHEIPIVFFDRVCEDIESDKVIVDDEQGAFLATEHLINVGCKRIVHLAASEHLLISKERKAGYLRAMNTYNMNPEPDWIIKCETREEARIVIPSLLSGPTKPDGLFVVNDLTAAEAMKIIKEHGYKVPDEIAIVGFTNGDIADLTDPALSSVEQFGYDIGKEAVHLLIDRLEKEEDYPPITRVINTQLIKKESSLR
jgi:LacI family transcriptional regulator